MTTHRAPAATPSQARRSSHVRRLGWPGRLSAAALAALLTACGAPDSAHDRAAALGMAEVAQEIAPAPPPASGAAGLTANRAGQAGASDLDIPTVDYASARQATAAGQDADTRMLIRTGDASIEVADVDTAAAAVQSLATTLGGYVKSSSRQSGAYDVRSATLQLRIPAARFDEAMGGLRPLGKVEYVNVAAQDVGEEYTDTQARMRNQQRLESRLVELLANRTGKLEDVLAVERELARVRETIERYEGRLRYLDSRVALSTLTVTVHERAPLAGTAPGRNPIVEAFGQGWRNLVGFVAGFIAALGVILPMGALAGLAWYLARRFLPRRGAARGTDDRLEGKQG